MGGNVFKDISAGIISPVNVTCDKVEHPIKAFVPILVTSGGIDIEVNDVVEVNALSPILVTPEGMVMLVKFSELLNTLFPMIFNEESASNVTVVKFGILANTPSDRVVTPEGMVMDVKAANSNALTPMLVTPEGMVMALKFVVPWNAPSPMVFN